MLAFETALRKLCNRVGARRRPQMQNWRQGICKITVVSPRLHRRHCFGMAIGMAMRMIMMLRKTFEAFWANYQELPTSNVARHEAARYQCAKANAKENQTGCDSNTHILKLRALQRVS